jgi:hypothetical protein
VAVHDFRLATTLWSLAAAGSLITGCTFDGGTASIGDGGGLPADANVNQADADPAAPDADPAAPDAGPPDAALQFDAEPGTPDARPCDFDDEDICDTGDPDGPLIIDASTTFNTDNDPLCRPLAQTDGPDACLVVVDSFTINGGARFIAIGSRPLVVASVSDINLNDLFDVSSRISGQVGAGANFADCAVATAPEGDVGGSGGGAGGSFGGAGGDGGDGDEDQSSGSNGAGLGGTASSSVSQPAFLRGGCPGGAGAERNDTDLTPPGNGGGAVFLLTPANINLNAGSAIRATGAGGIGGRGGDHAGGGGGGSGGHIILEAANINHGGDVGANGGGGGEGGVNFGGGVDTDGNDGADGAVSATGANGGSGASQFGGNGGDGSTQADLDGENASGDDGGGGGGGGAAGYIVFRGTVNDNGGLTSPPFIQE